MSDGMAGTEGGENVKVLDIAEILLGRHVPGATGMQGRGHRGMVPHDLGDAEIGDLRSPSAVE